MRISKYAYWAAATLALLVGAVVFLLESNADDRAIAGKTAVAVWVATAHIDEGISLADAEARHLVAVEHFPRGALPVQAIRLGHNAGSDNRRFYVAVKAGQLILKTDFLKPETTNALPVPAGKVAITINLDDAARVGGFVVAGNVVGIYFSKAQNLQTRMLVPDAQVLAVGNQSASLAPNLVTLALNPADAERVLVATRSGSVTLALLGSGALR